MHFAFGGERECKNASPLSSNASAASNHLAFAPPLGTEGGAAEPRRSQPRWPRGRRRPPEHPNRRRPSSSSAALVKLVHRGSSTAGRPPSSSSSTAGRELVRALEAGEPEAGAPDASRTRRGPARIRPERAPPPREASSAGLHCGSPATASHGPAEGAPPWPRARRRREPRRAGPPGRIPRGRSTWRPGRGRRGSRMRRRRRSRRRRGSRRRRPPRSTRCAPWPEEGRSRGRLQGRAAARRGWASAVEGDAEGGGGGEREWGKGMKKSDAGSRGCQLV